MTILTYNEVIEKGIEIEADANDYFSDEIDMILEEGFDSSKPIVVDQYGEILDGNHRFEAFESNDRIDELRFVICDYKKFQEYSCNENDEIQDKFNNDDDYFYSIIPNIAA